VNKELALENIGKVGELIRIPKVQVLIAHNVPWYGQNKGESALSITLRGIRRFGFKHLLECVLTPDRVQTTPPVHLGLVLPPFQIFMCSTAIVFYAMGGVRPRVNGRQ
jgi:hypothetical protein